ncbi:MAG: hypothetical protein ACOY0T_28485 [Myxococcota bacterium]
MSGSLKYPWHRYWVPSGTDIRTDLDGFIADPATTYGRAAAEGACLLEQLNHQPVLGLEGDAGLGKTTAVETAVERLVALGHDAAIIPLRECASLDEAVQKVKLRLPAAKTKKTRRRERSAAPDDASTILFVDGIDEVSFGDELVRLADALPSSVRLRYVCRAGAWPYRMRRRIPSDCFYELLPLTRSDLVAAATQHLLDADKFMGAVLKKNIAILASRPTTLIELVQQFEMHGELNGSRLTLMDQACRRHSEEHNELRRDHGRKSHRTTVDERVRIAGRVALHTLTSACATIDSGPIGIGDSRDRLFIADLAGGEEHVSGSAFRVDEVAVTETLEICGFISATKDRGRMFGARVFAEFLAAAYLTELNIPLQQLLSIVSHQHRPDRIAAQLRGLATELCSRRYDFAQWILRNDPSVILGADVSGFTEEQRRRIVNSMLLSAEDLVRVDMFASRLVLSTVRHYGIADQLREVLQDQNRSLYQRDLAIDITGFCKLAELADALAAIAVCEIEPLTLKRAAAATLVRIDAVAVSERLLPLAQADVDEELFGCAMQLLWPSKLPGDPFAYLRRPRNRRSGGVYGSFLSLSLAPRLTPDLLPHALAWAERVRVTAHSDYDIERARDAIVRRAMDYPEVVDGLARVVSALIQQHEELPLTDGAANGAEPIDRDARRRLVLALCGSPNRVTPTDLLFSQPRLLLREDFEWAIRVFASSSNPETAEQWALACERLLWSHLDADVVDAFVRLSEELVVVRERFRNCFEVVELGSDRAKQLKREAARYSAFGRPPRQSTSRPAISLARALKESEELDGSGWPHVALALSSRSGSEDNWSAKTYTESLRNLPTSTRTRVIAEAIRYVTTRDDSSAEWQHTNSYPYRAFAGYIALRLIAELEPSRFGELDMQVFGRWSVAILAARDFLDTVEHDSVLMTAYRLAPEAMLDAIRRRARGENAAHQNIFVFRRVASIMDARVEGIALELVRDPALSDAALEELLETLLDRGTGFAVDIGMRLVQQALATDANEIAQRRGVTAALTLIEKKPRESWPQLHAAMRASPVVARALVERLARRFHRNGANELAAALEPSEIADLYLLLGGLSDPSSETRSDLDDDDETPAEGLPEQFGSSVLRALAGSGRPGSRESLVRVQEATGRDLWHLIKEAEERELSESWRPMSTKQVRDLLYLPHRRRGDSPEQLLDVILGALETVQARLHGSPPLVRFLWNETPAPSRKNESALSDFLRDQLIRQLSEVGAIVHREVEIRPGLGPDAGQEPDIVVAATGPNSGTAPRTIEVPIEVKGDWHREVRSALKTQLVERYLRAPPMRAGLYVVGYFDSEQKGSAGLDELRAELDQQAREHSRAGRTIRAVVIDCRLRLPERGLASPILSLNSPRPEPL